MPRVRVWMDVKQCTATEDIPLLKQGIPILGVFLYFQRSFPLKLQFYYYCSVHFFFIKISPKLVVLCLLLIFKSENIIFNHQFYNIVSLLLIKFFSQNLPKIFIFICLDNQYNYNFLEKK